MKFRPGPLNIVKHQGSMHPRDYHGCIWMHPDKYPWMVDKFLWIWMISMDYPHHPQN